MSGGDFLVASSAAFLCFVALSHFGYLTAGEYHLWRAAPLAGLLFVISMYLSDAYSLEREDYLRTVVAILASCFSLVLIISLAMHRNISLLATRRLYIISLAVITVCLILWRFALELFAKRHVARTIVILGNTRIGKILRQEIQERWRLGYRLVYSESSEQRSRAVGENISAGQVHYLPAFFDNLIRDSRPLTLVVDAAESLPLAPEQLLKMRAMGIGINDCESFYELITGKLPVTELRHTWLIFAPGFARRRLSVAAKRLIDIVLSCTLLVLTLPISLIVLVAVKLDSRGSIFYQQDRVGLGGVVFRIFKFRSM